MVKSGRSPKRSKRVFVLGGGAALGAHQVGTMKFLAERGITPDAIVSSSIGVINACLYVTGGIDHMEHAWTNIGSVTGKFRPSLRDNPITGKSLFSMDLLAESIERYLDFEKILDSPLECSFVVLNVSRGEGQFVSNRNARSARDLRTLSRAGYAIPILFPPVRYRGELYVDGGFAWNVPVLQAIEMGATEVYVIAAIASELPFQRTFKGPVSYYSRLVDVLWRTIGNVGYATTNIDRDGTYQETPVTVLKPTEAESGFNPLTTFSWNAARTRKLITMGYRDAKREFARIDRRRKAHMASEPLADVVPAYRHEIGHQTGRDVE
jgi:NTE family protein